MEETNKQTKKHSDSPTNNKPKKRSESSPKTKKRSESPWRERTAQELSAWVKENARWQPKVQLVRENELEKLDLSWAALGTEGACTPTAAHRVNPRVISSGATALAAAMRYNDKLTSLRLDCNALGPEGGRLVVQACQKHEVSCAALVAFINELPRLCSTRYITHTCGIGAAFAGHRGQRPAARGCSMAGAASVLQLYHSQARAGGCRCTAIAVLRITIQSLFSAMGGRLHAGGNELGPDGAIAVGEVRCCI